MQVSQIMTSAATGFLHLKTLVVLMKILSAQWTAHFRSLLNLLPLTVRAYLTLSSHNTLPVSKVPVLHPWQTVWKTISHQCVPLKWGGGISAVLSLLLQWLASERCSESSRGVNGARESVGYKCARLVTCLVALLLVLGVALGPPAQVSKGWSPGWSLFKYNFLEAFNWFLFKILDKRTKKSNQTC